MGRAGCACARGSHHGVGSKARQKTVTLDRKFDRLIKISPFLNRLLQNSGTSGLSRNNSPPGPGLENGLAPNSSHSANPIKITK
jgi:hypothetical protein